MLCLGRANYFRFNHPEQAMKLRGSIPRDTSRSAVYHEHTNGGKVSTKEITFTVIFRDLLNMVCTNPQIESTNLFSLILYYGVWCETEVKFFTTLGAYITPYNTMRLEFVE